jgi:hypothetical protein
MIKLNSTSVSNANPTRFKTYCDNSRPSSLCRNPAQANAAKSRT